MDIANSLTPEMQTSFITDGPWKWLELKRHIAKVTSFSKSLYSWNINNKIEIYVTLLRTTGKPAYFLIENYWFSDFINDIIVFIFQLLFFFGVLKIISTFLFLIKKKFGGGGYKGQKLFSIDKFI